MNKRKKYGLPVVALLIVLLVAGIIIGAQQAKKNGLKKAAEIDCPVFDTREYTVGTELADRDLTTLLSEGIDASYDIRYKNWLKNVRFTDLEANSFPAPFAVLLKTAQDDHPVFCKPDGLEIAESLSEARTLIYIVQSGPYESGNHFYSKYRPYVFTLSGKYFLPGETGITYMGDTVQEGLVKSIESFGIAESGSTNPLEQYVANFERISAFDFMGLIESAEPEEEENAIEYRLKEQDDGIDYTDWRVIPCYDLTKGYWRHGEFELNGEPPLRIMTSEVVGETAISGSYATIGTAYVQILLIRVYDCDTGKYIEFQWTPDTSARHAVSTSRMTSDPPWVYYRVK